MFFLGILSVPVACCFVVRSITWAQLQHRLTNRLLSLRVRTWQGWSVDYRVVTVLAVVCLNHSGLLLCLVVRRARYFANPRSEAADVAMFIPIRIPARIVVSEGGWRSWELR